MKILSHRGFWESPEEKNTQIAFSRSFELGFGTETDVRDYMGELVISHDIPNGGEMTLLSFLELASTFNSKTPLTLALNIKADGLAKKVSEITLQFPSLDIFVFDMSVPDTRDYFKVGIPVFARMSEVERESVWLDYSTGIWLDAFDSEWYSSNFIVELLSYGRRVCLVSPELHGRQHMPLWQSIADLNDHSEVMICTDFPMHAQDYFAKVKK